MKHLSEGNAADLVRGIASAGDRRWMEAHLKSGCLRCKEAVGLLRVVSGFALTDNQWEPPGEVLERAADIFPERRNRVAALRHRLVARLMYDSYREPLPTGIRASRDLSRQLLYRAGDFFLDLRIHREHSDHSVTLVGQVAARKPRGTDRSRTTATPVSVLLMYRHAVVAEAPLNRFGEFHLEYEAQPHLRLRVPLGAAQTGVELPLSRLLKPPQVSMPGRSDRSTSAR